VNLKLTAIVVSVLVGTSLLGFGHTQHRAVDPASSDDQPQQRGAATHTHLNASRHHASGTGHGRAQRRAGGDVSARRGGCFVVSTSPTTPRRWRAGPAVLSLLSARDRARSRCSGADCSGWRYSVTSAHPSWRPSPADGEYLLVTDADAGTLTSIELADMLVVGRVAVGAGAHHLATSLDRRRAWVALGETADHARDRRHHQPASHARRAATAPGGGRP